MTSPFLPPEPSGWRQGGTYAPHADGRRFGQEDVARILSQVKQSAPGQATFVWRWEDEAQTYPGSHAMQRANDGSWFGVFDFEGEPFFIQDWRLEGGVARFEFQTARTEESERFVDGLARWIGG